MDAMADIAGGQNRVVHTDGRWFAVDGSSDLKKILIGRLEGLGPVFEDDPRISLRGEEKALLLELEHEGAHPAHAARRAQRLVRAASAGAHSPFHGGEAAARDRAGQPQPIPAVSRLLAACG